jgi:hypothetical protein
MRQISHGLFGRGGIVRTGWCGRPDVSVDITAFLVGSQRLGKQITEAHLAGLALLRRLTVHSFPVQCSWRWSRWRPERWELSAGRRKLLSVLVGALLCGDAGGGGFRSLGELCNFRGLRQIRARWYKNRVSHR